MNLVLYMNNEGVDQPESAPFAAHVSRKYSIIELFGHRKGGNFSNNIWASFGYFIYSRREIKFYLFGNKELISCLSCANVCAFHENPDPYIY